MKEIVRDIDGKTFDRYRFFVGKDIGQFLVDWFEEWFETSVKQGMEVEDDHNLLYGWAFLKCEIKDRELQLFAPDFSSSPLAWTSNISAAIHCAVCHRYVPESFELDMEIPTMAETAVVGKNFEELPMFMVRSEKSDMNDKDSGWFIGNISGDIDINDPDNLSVITMYEAVIKAPHILKYISLPMKSQVIFETPVPVILYDEKEMTPLPQSFMEAELNLLKQQEESA